MPNLSLDDCLKYQFVIKVTIYNSQEKVILTTFCTSYFCKKNNNNAQICQRREHYIIRQNRFYMKIPKLFVA
jgi:hypothetical protein